MPDFYQHSRLPTLHHLADADAKEREREIVGWAKEKPVVLLLPALFEEFENHALPAMLPEIAKADFVDEVVLSVNGMDANQLTFARRMCEERLGGKKFSILWNDGPALQAVFRQMEQRGCPPYAAGKGMNVWAGLAYLQARGHRGIVIGHDTDILNYRREILWRLAFPVASPDMPYRFAKGYYTRMGERLYGRATRLLVFPLLQAVMDVLGPKPMVAHLESFRYPLAGEFAAEMELLSNFSLPTGWGLELAILGEIQRKLTVAEMCQVDLGINFEHHHRKLETDVDAVAKHRDVGLAASAVDVARSLFDQVLSDAEPRAAEKLLHAVRDRYGRRAAEWVERYAHVARINGMKHDKAEENRTVATFAAALEGIVGDGGGSGRPVLRPAVREVVVGELRELLLAAGEEA